MSKHRRKPQLKEEQREFGFGNKLTDTTTRLINKDGSFNVVRNNKILGRYYLDPYHRFITMRWRKFFMIFLLFFFGINGAFAIVYTLLGSEQFQGVSSAGYFSNFWDMYFFSTQTFTTVGYGHIAPIGWLASMIASLESVVGWLSFAIATGLLYGRFARPQARILYSKHAIVSPYKDGMGLMFRIANARNSQLIEVETEVILSLIDKGNGNETPRRKYYNLNLELNRINLLSLSWTVVHSITDSSPLYGVTLQDLKDCDAEFWVMIKAFDDTFAQVVYQRTSYSCDEITWGAKFKPMYSPIIGSSKIALELDKISEIEKVDLPELILEVEEEERGVSDL